MSAVLGALERVKFDVLALVLGVLLVVIACFDVRDIKKLSLARTAAPNWWVFGVGLALVLAGVGMALLPGFMRTGDSFANCQSEITEMPHGIEVRIGQNVLGVRFGHLEDSADLTRSLVILPANDLFNDACINDRRSALGAFVLTRFPGKTAQFEDAVKDGLTQLPAPTVQVGTDGLPRYELGTSVYLDHPLGESMHLLVCAATELTSEGLRGDLRTVFTIARKAYAVAGAYRLDTIHAPLVGAGHGAIKPARALLTQLLAWAELMYRDPDRRLTVDVIVFQRDTAAHAEIPRQHTRELLALAASLCEP
jgi:hypothetical protein